MLKKESVYEGIETLSKELEESIEDFKANKTWTIAKGIRDLTDGILGLYQLCDVMDASPEDYDEEVFTMVEAEKWVKNMLTEMEDGSRIKGEHWTLDQTTLVARQKGIVWEHITPYCFWVTMNMIYSDYSEVAKKHGVDEIDFYVDMAKAFLFDIDSVPPRKKLTEYYHHIVKPVLK